MTDYPEVIVWIPISCLPTIRPELWVPLFTMRSEAPARQRQTFQIE